MIFTKKKPKCEIHRAPATTYFIRELNYGFIDNEICSMITTSHPFMCFRQMYFMAHGANLIRGFTKTFWPPGHLCKFKKV